MKKILLILSLLLLSRVVVNAQCTFGNVGVKINSSHTDPTTNKCVINFDLYFDVEHNPGGKYFWVHIWPTSSYPDYSYPQSHPPTTSNVPGENNALDNSIMTFGYFHQGSALNPQLSYPPDPSVPGFQTGYTLTEVQGTPDRYTAHGVTLILPQDCNIPQSLTADLWESQSAQAQTVACVSKNQRFYVNDPTIVNGLLFCALPRTYKFDITTLSTASRSIDYQVRIDNGDGIYNSVTDTLIIKSGNVSITNTTPYQSGIQSYLPYSNVKPYADKALWVIVLKNGIDLPNDVYARLDNGCSPLPVQFGSFTAVRNKTNVTLKWATATEINNSGFYIERKNGNADWQIINFIASQAVNGSSTDELQYSYIDNNNLPGVSLYRLRQVDIDNKIAYSDIRMVKGIDQIGGVIVFPNPTSDGQFTVVLDKYYEGSIIKMVDMNGKLIKEWSNITTNRLNVNNVSPGMYMLQVWSKTINETQVIKVIVTK